MSVTRHAAQSPGTAEGVPIVIVPGWCCDASSVDSLVDRLRQHHRVVVVDLPGHGSAPAPPPQQAVSIESLAAHVTALLGQLELGPVCLVGHSMGAAIALVCGADPRLVPAVVALDPSPILDQAGKDFFARSVAAVRDDDDGAWRRRFVERLLGPTEAPGRAELVAAFTALRPDVAAAECRAMAQFEGRTVLAAVRARTLLVTARAPDPELVAALPGVRAAQVVGSGHFIALEVPDQVAALVEEFLGG